MRRILRSWLPETIETLFRHRLFSLERQWLRAESGEGGVSGEPAAEPARREALVIRAPDWVNVVAVDGEGAILLVRQWRYGVAAPTLEIPGGMVDAGESAFEAAQRELLEETGHRATAWRQLGVVDPNPAFLSNRCTTFLALDAYRVGDPNGDGEEELEVTRAARAEIPALIRRGEIRHALVVAAFHWLDLAGWPTDPS